MRVLFIVLTLGFSLVCATTSLAACAKPKYSAAYLKRMPTKGINQTLFSEALTLEANYARCKQGRKLLKTVPQITQIAAGHAGWMALRTKLSHNGARAFKPRMRSSGVKFKTAAENIANFNRYDFPKGQFKIRNASACKFTTQSGAAIPAHSYASLARIVVNGWMKSSGHKKNLMNRKMRLAGGGVAFDAKAPNCGRFYITQDYMG